MGEEVLDKYRLAGLDERERGFSRLIGFERAGEYYRAILRYESTCVVTEPHAKQDVALLVLVQTLQVQGYRQLRTQMSFRHGTYLGSQESWVEYPDPPQLDQPVSGLLEKLPQLVSSPQAVTYSMSFIPLSELHSVTPDRSSSGSHSPSSMNPARRLPFLVQG